MPLSRRSLLTAALALPASARAQATRPLRIGVLGDESGPYADLGGPGSVIAARLAAEEIGNRLLDRPIEVITGDHQNKPDLASSIARHWIDTVGVDVIADGASSGAALAIQQVAREKGCIFVITTSGSSDLTGKACSPFGFHFSSDTYALAQSTGGAVTARGGRSWFFLTVDYAFGHALERDATRAVQAAGGKVLGAAVHPVGTTDFSSFLLQAKASGAQVIGIANAGPDTQNAIKQATEFGLVAGGQSLAALLMFETDVAAIGLQTAQGLVLSNSFYWDLNPATRDWTRRFRARKDSLPTMNQAGTYSGVRHFLRAVRQAGTTEPATVAAAMRALKVSDMYNDEVTVRADGRVLQRMYLMQVKSPAQSASASDIYQVLSSAPGEAMFRPVAESACPLLHP